MARLFRVLSWFFCTVFGLALLALIFFWKNSDREKLWCGTVDREESRALPMASPSVSPLYERVEREAWSRCRQELAKATTVDAIETTLSEISEVISLTAEERQELESRFYQMGLVVIDDVPSLSYGLKEFDRELNAVVGAERFKNYQDLMADKNVDDERTQIEYSLFILWRGLGASEELLSKVEVILKQAREHEYEDSENAEIDHRREFIERQMRLLLPHTQWLRFLELEQRHYF